MFKFYLNFNKSDFDYLITWHEWCVRALKYFTYTHHTHENRLNNSKTKQNIIIIDGKYFVKAYSQQCCFSYVTSASKIWPWNNAVICPRTLVYLRVYA